MRCTYKRLFTILILQLFVVVGYGQKVSNITAEQIGQTIKISYTLVSESECDISLYYSLDNGSRWIGPLKRVSGDVGYKIIGGNKKIIWDVLSEVDQFKFEGVIFKVQTRLNDFKEVKIGNQIWSAENLDVDHFVNGEIISEVKESSDWFKFNLKEKPAWCFYNNDSSNCIKYGRLYNYYAIANLNSLCPRGFRVPTVEDWAELMKYVNEDCESIRSESDWINNLNGNNFTRLGLRPSGARDATYASFEGLQKDGLYGVYPNSLKEEPSVFYISPNGSCGLSLSDFRIGFSVRCMKDVNDNHQKQDCLPAPIVNCQTGRGTYKYVYSWAAVRGAISYEVTEDGGVTWIAANVPNGPETHGSATAIPSFIVRAIGSGLCKIGANSKPIGCEVIIPSIITPNGDRKNDEFIIPNIERYPDNEVQIINRWGKEVFSADGYNNTTKVFKGTGCPDGVYFVLVNLNDGDTPIKTGNLTIER